MLCTVPVNVLNKPNYNAAASIEVHLEEQIFMDKNILHGKSD